MNVQNYPDIIISTPSTLPVLKALFNYSSRTYDLNAYETVARGSGEKIWKMFVTECEHRGIEFNG